MPKKPASGFTLFELLIVVSLIGLLSVPILTGGIFTGGKSRLDASAESFQGDVLTIKNYARDARDKVSWGIKSYPEGRYELLSGTQSAALVHSQRYLETGIKFTSSVEVWFPKGGSSPTAPSVFTLIDREGRKYEIRINQVGLVEKIEP